MFYLEIFLSVQFFTLGLAATCYGTNGNTLDSTAFHPCDNATTHSACCLTNQSNGGPSDICTTAGLCLRQDSTPGFFYIDGCTDKSWASSSCPKFCSNKTQTVLQSCTDVGTGTWCCRASGEASCCESAFTTNVGILLVPSQTTIRASGSQTSSATRADSTSGSTPGTPTCAASGKDRSGVVGGAVGGVMGLLLLVSLGVLGWREKTRPKSVMAGSVELDKQAGHHGGYQDGRKHAAYAGPYEAGSNDVQELEGHTDRR